MALAPKLLGKVVKRGSCVGMIVETEAYTADPGSHAQKKTPRSLPMFETYGSWYVYFTYGMHWCANVTTNKGSAGAVLIRAVEPLEGLALMKRRRTASLKLRSTGGISDVKNLANGPAKFCQAFGITGKDNRAPASGRAAALNDFGIFALSPRDLSSRNRLPRNILAAYDTTIYGSIVCSEPIGVSGRIGISTGADLPWRFYIKGNPFVSR